MKIQFLALAEIELDEALTHYLDKGGRVVAERFLAQVQGLLDLIVAHPELGHVDSHELRRFGLKHFPFDLVYRVDDEQVTVVALAHHRRRPRYWAQRLNPGGE